jgi:hypothetical protein
MKRSKILTDHTQVNKETDRNHIDYVVPPLDDEKQKDYANFIARECIIHGIRVDASNNYNEWRSMLCMSIAMEKYILFLENVRKWDEDGHDKVPLVEVLELLIPCILHLENRAGEKLVTTIIKKGLDLYDSGPKEDFLKALQHMFQTIFFGSEKSPSHWKL